MIWPRTKYNLLTEELDGYIFALVRAVALTPEVTEAIMTDVRNAVLDVRAVRLMFEYEAAHVLDDEETLGFTNELIGRMRGMRIALIARDSKHRLSLCLAEAIALDRGVEFRSFSDLTGAEQWLLDD